MMNYIATFDIDNTLIRSSDGHMESLTSAIKDVYGLATGMHLIKHHGMTDQEIIIGILEKSGVNGKIVRSRLKKCTQNMQQHYTKIVQTENIVILGGILNLLTKLEQKGFYLGLVTGNLEEIARAKLAKIGIGDFFRFGGFGSDHIRRAELVKIAIKRARKSFYLANDLRIFHFGDAPQDMQAAREGGAVPVGVATGVFSADELGAAGAYRVVANLENTDEVLQILQSI